MKKIDYILFFISILFIGYSNTARAIPPVPCNYEGTQIELTSCSIEEYEKADKILNKIYQEKMHLLNKSKHDELRKQQRKWIKQIKYDCKAEADEEAEGGSMWPMLFNSCLAERTKKRTNELNAIK